VIDIIYTPNHTPPSLPIAVIVKFDDYIGPSFFNRKSFVPITPVTAGINTEKTIHERQQLPLTLAWALTIHKSQGMTLDYAWVNVGKKELTVGMTYVALSRVRNLSSLIIEPITFDRLTSIKQLQTLKYRVKEQERLKKIANKTRQNQPIRYNQ
jgi:ATP-dependent exoDNAse (exonuclease V) alpha subunit